KNYRTYMELVDRCLVPGGVSFVHTIGGGTTESACDPWTQKYIFPNGHVPSAAQLARAMEGLFVVDDLHNIGPHYDPTLMAWYARRCDGKSSVRMNTRDPALYGGSSMTRE